MTSFFRFPRSLSRHPSFLQASPFHRIIFMTFLDHMCFEKKEFNAHGHIILLEQGQFCTTEREFAELCGFDITRHHVARGWDYFSKCGFLRHEVRQRKTIITLTHKETYEILFQEMSQDLRQTCAKLAPQTKNVRTKEVSFVKKETRKKKENVVVSVSFSDSKKEEFMEGLLAFCEFKNIQISEESLKRWLAKYSQRVVTDVLTQLSQSKTPARNPEAWMESVLPKSDNLMKNKSFIERFRVEKSWNSLTIMKQYCRDEDTGNDYQFNLPNEEFERIIQTKFREKREAQ